MSGWAPPAPALESAQEAQRWADALGTYQRMANGKTAQERARAAGALADAVSEKYERQCWQLAYGLLRQEIAREGPGGKTEEKVSGDVLHACLKAFRRLSNKDVVAEMVKVARAKAENPRARTWVVWGLAKSAPLKDLTDLIDDRVLAVQVAAMDALAERADKESAPLFLKLAGSDRTW
ncbi:MAG TPA: hypothetical protein VEJ18_05890, partial [Planctomycetota bacterium]|nr:hypothetical protein [Planctomycetota bacterium]